MNSFGVLLVCVQICLIQNVFTQCLGPGLPGPYGYGPAMGPAYAPGIGPGYPGYPALAPAVEVPGYGGTGIGDVAVAGEMPVVGTTLVAGQVPILGAVRFAGELPAIGTVSVAGSCGCGCGAPGYYY